MTMAERLDCDYLVVGSGAMAMAFVDELLAQTSGCTVIMLDQHAKPGGHWNDAYPWVRLHQPAAHYGVNSRNLGDGGASLSSRDEILYYYEEVMKGFLQTGRVRYFPMCEYVADGRFRHVLASDACYDVSVRRRIVDASYLAAVVPSVQPPQYEAQVPVIPINDLVKVRSPHPEYVVVGAGKTGIDAVLWLLDSGAPPARLRWVVPNDPWLLLRDPGGPRKPGVGEAAAGRVGQNLLGLEAMGVLQRLDADVWPEKFRCASVSRAEVAKLQRIPKESVVRLGRLLRAEPRRLVLERGSVATAPGALHVDCSTDGLRHRPERPIFEEGRMTLQSLFICQQVASASILAYVEAHCADDSQKNELCQPVPHPVFNADWPVVANASLANFKRLLSIKGFKEWFLPGRLSGVVLGFRQIILLARTLPDSPVAKL